MKSLETGRAEICNRGKSRVMLLPMELSRMLKKYCGEAGIPTGSIFVTKHGNLVSRSNMGKKMKQLARGAGVDENRVFPHNFRRLFTRISYSMEKDVVRLTDSLEHVNIGTARVYTITTEDQPGRQMSRIWMVLG